MISQKMFSFASIKYNGYLLNIVFYLIYSYFNTESNLFKQCILQKLQANNIKASLIYTSHRYYCTTIFTHRKLYNKKKYTPTHTHLIFIKSYKLNDFHLLHISLSQHIIYTDLIEKR